MRTGCSVQTKKRLFSGLNLYGILILTLSLSSAGCATVRGEKYTYKNLPPRFMAGLRENPQTVDLTRLASMTSRSDVLDRGDVVEVTISAGLGEKDTIKIPVRIHDDGCGEIPQLGRVQLAGMKVTAAEAAIYRECVNQGLYHSPGITVMMKEQRMNRIMVCGAVKKPSVYEIPRGQSDLMAALSKAEGLDPTAGTQVIIRNPGGRGGSRADSIASESGHGIDNVSHTVESTGMESDTMKVDLISATKSGNNGYMLDDGAMVYVEKRDPEPLYVFGLVSRPGRFDFPIAEELRVTDAIALAGGVSSLAADKIFVIRRKPIDPDSNRPDPNNPDKVNTFIIQVSLANAKQDAKSNIRLAPGDEVSVEQTPLTFMLESLRRIGMNIGGTVPLMGL